MNNNISPNFRNISYYENVPPQELQQISITSGLETYPDLEMIYPIIKTSKKILEIGGGYGRTLDFLIKNHFHGQVDILEPTDNFHSFLKEKYPQRFNIYKEFIQNFTPTVKYDLVLWLWSNIIEFPPFILKKILRNLHSAIEQNGLLVIESIRENTDPVGLEAKTEKTALVDLHYGTLQIFTYTKKDILNFAEQCGFKVLEMTDYQLSSGRSRTLFLLTKANTPV